MEPALRERLQIEILRVLDANPSTRFGLGLYALTIQVSVKGFPMVTNPEVEKELEYLGAKGLIMHNPKLLEPSIREWKLTAAGRDYLSEREPA